MHIKKITIGNNCLIAANTNIIDANGHEFAFENASRRIYSHDTFNEAKPIIIEDDVWIGLNSLILPGLKLGRGSIIGAGSLVTKSIPKMSLAAGNPAKY